MLSPGSGSSRRPLLRAVMPAFALTFALLVTSSASATITQGDFEIFGTLGVHWSGRWGEGGAKGVLTDTQAARESGGSFDFERWDLVQAKQVVDLRPGYHIVRNYNLLGRVDTLFVKDASIFAIYRGWYDAFPDFKHHGRAEPNGDWPNYTRRDKVAQFVRNDLREFYLHINVTDNLSLRIGKQQVIWTEADALSGTEVTNPSDLRFHWTHFENPEDLRKNIRMVKLNYTLPNFLKTTSNLFEAFWIPGDWVAAPDGLVTNSSTPLDGPPDSRSPYVAFVPLTNVPAFNEEGRPVRNVTVADTPANPTTPVPALLASALGLPISPAGGPFADSPAITLTEGLSNSPKDSEFGTRYSTLLPIGNGLQVSLLYLYEARFDKLGFCITCPAPPGTIPVPGTGAGTGVFIVPGNYFNSRRATDPAGISLIAELRDEFVRQHIFGITGTYYDNDLTDVVFRYDFAWRPKFGVGLATPQKTAPVGDSGTRWTENGIFIIAFDRPTMIPWISKQHTFLIAQHTLTWYPDLPRGATNFFGNFNGKLRGVNNLTFVGANNWIQNGRLVATNLIAWDWDDQVGNFISTNSYRLRQNLLLNFNLTWYLGRSGRYTDPFAFSRDQRINEVEFRFTYEI